MASLERQAAQAQRNIKRMEGELPNLDEKLNGPAYVELVRKIELEKTFVESIHEFKMEQQAAKGPVVSMRGIGSLLLIAIATLIVISIFRSFG